MALIDEFREQLEGLAALLATIEAGGMGIQVTLSADEKGRPLDPKAMVHIPRHLTRDKRRP